MHRVLAIAILVTAAGVVLAGEDGGNAVTVAKSDLGWKDMGILGIQSAVVSGDIAKGPSRFFLKYPVGLATPAHHHTPDHYVTVVSGALMLTAGGKETKLEAGSFFALTGKAVHVARVLGNEECIIFIQADGPWDVVPEK